MSNEVKYISYEEALNVYNKMIDASEGGFDGVRERVVSLLLSTLYKMICTIPIFPTSYLIWYLNSVLVITSMTVTNV